jgi:choline dehydrogenase
MDNAWPRLSALSSFGAMNMNQLTQSRAVVADYIVVGTGSAGSVVAEGLTADPSNTVVVLEAGAEDSDKRIHIPATWSHLFRTDVDWDYLTEPQQQLNGRQIYWPRGRTLGGSSSMNAMMWVRGFAADYDEWALHAGDEWAFARMVQYFKRIEGVQGAAEADQGTRGPIHVSKQRSPRRSTAAWLEAVKQSGYSVERPNLPQPNGFTETMVTQRRGARWSTADAYLRPALRRKNLRLLTKATVGRVVFENARAVGVEFEKDGRWQFVRARREIVLCAGVVNSPQLLMLSGVGHGDHLQQVGIRTIHHSPEVGENLHDHLVAALGFEVGADSLFTAGTPRQILNYLIRRRGMLTSPAGEAYGFVRSDPELALPDLELFFGPAPFFDEGLAAPNGHGVLLGAILLKPHSRGRLWLRSHDPKAKPAIDPQYLSDSGGADRAALTEGLRMSAQIAAAPALKEVLGSMVRPLGATDATEDALATAINAESHTMYHPVGTCRMGADPESVVTPQLLVRGVLGLRVADASVMPNIVRGHTHAASVLIGAKAVDLITAAKRG